MMWMTLRKMSQENIQYSEGAKAIEFRAIARFDEYCYAEDLKLRCRSFLTCTFSACLIWTVFLLDCMVDVCKRVKSEGFANIINSPFFLVEKFHHDLHFCPRMMNKDEVKAEITHIFLVGFESIACFGGLFCNGVLGFW